MTGSGRKASRASLSLRSRPFSSSPSSTSSNPCAQLKAFLDQSGAPFWLHATVLPVICPGLS